MAIVEIKWELVKDTYFFDTTTCYLSEDGNHMFYSGNEKRIEILIDDLNELVRKGCAMWLKLGEYEFALDKLSKCPTTTWYSINQKLYSLEPWGVMKESKNSARKSLKEEKEVWIIKSKDDLQYVGKKIFDVCEDIENARKFKSKFEAEEFLKKHDKALDYRYWKVINIVSESKESVRKSIKEEYDPTDDIINKGNSVGMDYETFLKFAEKQDYKFNVTDATFYFGINGNIKIEGRECSCIPSEDGILIIDNHSSIEIPRKDIDEVSGVSLNSKNVLRMDVFTKDGDVLTVWWEL